MTKIHFSPSDESSLTVANLWVSTAFSLGDSKLVSLITKKDFGTGCRFGVSTYRICLVSFSPTFRRQLLSPAAISQVPLQDTELLTTA